MMWIPNLRERRIGCQKYSFSVHLKFTASSAVHFFDPTGLAQRCYQIDQGVCSLVPMG